MAESTWAPSPQTSPINEIQKNVAGYVLMPADDEVLDCALQGIKRAVDRLNTRPWNWALTYFTVTFIAGTQEYALDQGFKQPRNFSLRNTSGTDIDRLMYLPWGTFLKEAQYDTAGWPAYYSASNPNFFGVVRLNFAPSASWVSSYPTGRLWYYSRVMYPSSTGFSLSVPSEAMGFIQASAEGYAADRYAPQKAMPAYSRAEKFFHELVVDDCHNQNTDWE